MSRIGKKPVVIPQGVKVQVENGLVRAEGPKGKLSQSLPDGLIARLENNTLVLTREADHRQARALHGTARALVANMRSEEHTSELQSHSDLVCRLLLEKKKKRLKQRQNTHVNQDNERHH